MPKINVSKDVMHSVLKHCFLHGMQGHPPASREEMVALMLRQADELMSRPAGQNMPEQGVICYGPDEQVKHVGYVRWPAPEVSAALLEGEGPRLVVVYGRPGSGVSTYIQSMIACGSGDVEVHDRDPGGNAANIAGAMRTLDNGGKAVVALGADTRQETTELLAYYTGAEWLNSPRGRELLHDVAGQ